MENINELENFEKLNNENSLEEKNGINSEDSDLSENYEEIADETMEIYQTNRNLDDCLEDVEEIVLGCGESDLPFVDDEELIVQIAEQVDEELNLSPISDITDKSKLEKAKDHFNRFRCDRNVAVYAKVNKDGFITELASDIFLKDLEGWTKIDEGDGDRYVHPQTSYFEDDLTDEGGNYQYKAPISRT